MRLDRVLRPALLFMAVSLVAQVLLVLVAISSGQRWLLWPLALGLWAMRLLPADPQTAGSFIVFPTLAQTVLALAVNTAAAAAALALIKAIAGLRKASAES